MVLVARARRAAFTHRGDAVAVRPLLAKRVRHPQPVAPLVAAVKLEGHRECWACVELGIEALHVCLAARVRERHHRAAELAARLILVAAKAAGGNTKTAKKAAPKVAKKAVTKKATATKKAPKKAPKPSGAAAKKKAAPKKAAAKKAPAKKAPAKKAPAKKAAPKPAAAKKAKK